MMLQDTQQALWVAVPFYGAVQIIDLPTLPIQEDISEVIQLPPQERISERAADSTRQCSRTSDSKTIVVVNFIPLKRVLSAPWNRLSMFPVPQIPVKNCEGREDHSTGLGSEAHRGVKIVGASDPRTIFRSRGDHSAGAGFNSSPSEAI